MNKQKLQQQLLNFAIQEAHLWLCKIPILDRRQVYERIMKCIMDKFREHEEELWSIYLFEIADHEYVIKVNVNLKGELLLKRKEEPDES